MTMFCARHISVCFCANRRGISAQASHFPCLQRFPRIQRRASNVAFMFQQRRHSLGPFSTQEVKKTFATSVLSNLNAGAGCSERLAKFFYQVFASCLFHFLRYIRVYANMLKVFQCLLFMYILCSCSHTYSYFIFCDVPG